MLKLFSQFWLILSLLVAPLPYATADMVMAEQGQMTCQNADQHAMHTEQSTDNTVSQKDVCECCDQCGSACSSCLHFSAGLSQVNNVPEHPRYDLYPHNAIETVAGLSRFIEIRPPRKLHA